MNTNKLWAIFSISVPAIVANAILGGLQISATRPVTSGYDFVPFVAIDVVAVFALLMIGGDSDS